MAGQFVQLSVIVTIAVCGSALGQFSSRFGGNSFQQGQPQFAPDYSQQQQQQQQFVSQNQVSQQRSSSCPDVNGTYPVAGQCDAYIECKNGVAEEKLCPDGLLFNDKLGPHHFPCQYPVDVSCENRAKLQPAQPTDECPHQFGYYKMGGRAECGKFMNCDHGRGHMFDCPEGLAFSQETYRCEWPDQVPDCDAEAYVGFTCPPEARSDSLTDFRFFRSATECGTYYICIEGRPRMYRCMGDKLFNDLTNQCDGAENVTCGGASGFRQQKVVQQPIVEQRPQQRQQQQQQQRPRFQQPIVVQPAVPQQQTAYSQFVGNQQQQQQSQASFNTAQQYTTAQPAVSQFNAFAATTRAPAPSSFNQFAFQQPAQPAAATTFTQFQQPAVQPIQQYTTAQSVAQFEVQPTPAYNTFQAQVPVAQTRNPINSYAQFNAGSRSRGSVRY